jgi:hypothetical protein
MLNAPKTGKTGEDLTLFVFFACLALEKASKYIQKYVYPF